MTIELCIIITQHILGTLAVWCMIAQDTNDVKEQSFLFIVALFWPILVFVGFIMVIYQKIIGAMRQNRYFDIK